MAGFGKREIASTITAATTHSAPAKKKAGCARQPGAEGRKGRTRLVAGKNPAEHEIGPLGAEALRRQPHRRRHGGDPVEPVKHRKQRQAIEREVRERQHQQREAP
jgi:hypothetical protein